MAIWRKREREFLPIDRAIFKCLNTLFFSCTFHHLTRRAFTMPNCLKCDDTGVIETGNNDLPCDCSAGNTAIFNDADVDGPVTGAEIKRHLLIGSPEPIEGPVVAADLPGRQG